MGLVNVLLCFPSTHGIRQHTALVIFIYHDIIPVVSCFKIPGYYLIENGETE